MAAALCGALLPSLPADHALAQTYPARPVRLVVAYPPGGPVDIMGRTIALRLTEYFGHNVLVDNRAGASGIVGTEIVARSAPDGYTLLVAPSAIAIQHTLYSKLPYDALKDLAWVASLAEAPLVLVVHPSVPARNVKELVALARARPGQLSYASPGSGSANHLSGEMLKAMAGLDVVHVPYKGGAPAEVDLLGGHVAFMFNTIPSALPHVRSGRLRALGITWARRSQTAPEIPTIAETALPGFDAGTWYGLAGPAGLPRNVVARISQDVNRALQSPEMKERMSQLGLQAMGGSPEDFDRFAREEVVKWAKVVKASGARAD